MRQVKEIFTKDGRRLSFLNSVCDASMVAADPACTAVYHGKRCVTDGISNTNTTKIMCFIFARLHLQNVTCDIKHQIFLSALSLPV